MKTAKLYIKGIKEPKGLSLLQGQEIERILKDKNTNDDEPVVVKDIWSGKKKDIKFIDWVSEKVTKEPEMDFDDYKEIEREIGEAKNTAVLNNFSEIHYPVFWFQMKGAIRLEFYEVDNKKQYTIYVINPASYIKLQDKLEIYKRKKSKLEFIEQKETEYLEKIVEQTDEIKF